MAGDEREKDDAIALLADHIARLGGALPGLADKLRAAAAARGQPPPPLPDGDVGARFAGFAEFLRRFGRPDGRPPAPMALRPTLDDVVALLHPELSRRARLVATHAPSPLVVATARQLAHLSANLLVNAAQAIADGDADANRIELRSGADERGWAVIDVADSGAGIPEELQQKIFETYFTTKRGRGGGLGLTITRELVGELGGELRLWSAPGKGATFRIALPPAAGAPR